MQLIFMAFEMRSCHFLYTRHSHYGALVYTYGGTRALGTYRYPKTDQSTQPNHCLNGRKTRNPKHNLTYPEVPQS
jgi:hypothetical protein